MSKNQLVILTLLAAGLVGSAQSESANPPHEKNPFLHVARELQNRRVVGLADFAHQNAFPFHTVTQVLSNWLSLVSPNGGQLTLALESDPRMVNVLRQYLQTGELDPLLDFWLPFSSLDQLEFYSNLRSFTLRMERLNRGLPRDHRISFQVLGLEPPSPLSATNLTVADLPNAWQAGAVANMRDSQIASNILAHLKANPMERVLVFYGDAHLCIRQARRSWATRVFGATDTWNPMGLLLKQQLGSNFLSVAQAQFPRPARDLHSPHHFLTLQDVFMLASDISWKHPRIDSADYDAVVFFSATTIDEAHLLKYICSRRVLDRATDRLALLENLPQNEFTARHPVFSSTLSGLRLTTGKSFQRSVEWKDWSSTNAYNGFARIDSPEFSEAIRSECGQPRKGPMLASLGLPFSLAFSNRQTTLEEWRDIWPKMQPAVRYFQCLGIYWVGYPEEKAQAREYLVTFSGEDFDSPALYLQWFRKNRMGLSY